MSGISSGIGLISGIDTAGLINQLMAIEARPLQTLQDRTDDLDTQRTALLDLSARLLATQNAALRFDSPSFFQAFSALSSNEGVLTATATSAALPGTHTFRVHSLVTSHALLSRGFADADKTAIGAGTLSIETGQGQVNRSLDLDSLNGGAGIRRGVIAITDGNGKTAEIDLTTAVTVDDVLQAINSNTEISVQASVSSIPFGAASGDRLVIENLDGTGSLSIADRSGGFTASDLGVAGSSNDGRIDGRNIVSLNDDTPLALLNDGLGISALGQASQTDDLVFEVAGPFARTFNVSLNGILAQQPDTDLRELNHGNGVRLGTIRITDRSEQTVDIDLSAAKTVQDVIDTINDQAAAAGLLVRAQVVNSNLQLSDESEVIERPSTDEDEESDFDLPEIETPHFIIEDVDGFAALDLGIADDVDGDAISGADIYAITTVGDVLRAINFASGNTAAAASSLGEGQVVASISDDGKRIVIATPNGIADSVRVLESPGGSTAAADLGLLDATADFETPFESRRLISGLDSVLLRTLNGGSGVTAGTITLTDRAGNTATVDLSQAETLREVIDNINQQEAIAVTASFSATGTGIELRDESDGAGTLEITDATGSLAADLHIAGSFGRAQGDTVRSGNLQAQYITLNTKLEELNGGAGVAEGDFTITDSNGGISVISLISATTVGDVIDAINLRTPDTILASLNATGDGILITDSAGGDQAMTIVDTNNGTAAKDLGIAREAAAGRDFIDGSFEIQIEIGAADTLDDIARKINESGALVRAATVNSGSLNPFSLTLTSQVTGRAGQLVIDTGTLDLGLRTLAKAQDAVVSIGGAEAVSPLLVTSSTNNLEGVIPGVTLDLLASSDDDVTVNISQDIDSIVEGIQSFVSRFNDVQDAIDDSTSFDEDTLQRGPLLGDRTVNQIRDRLQRTMTRSFDTGDPSFSRLFAVGIRMGQGSRLQFDEERFRQVYAETPERVEKLFTTEETGFGAFVKDALDELTRSFDGVIARRDSTLEDQQGLLTDRMERLNLLLDAKRARLEAQFIGLESNLARLQEQQTSLLTLSQLASNASVG